MADRAMNNRMARHIAATGVWPGFTAFGAVATGLLVGFDSAGGVSGCIAGVAGFGGGATSIIGGCGFGSVCTSGDGSIVVKL